MARTKFCETLDALGIAHRRVAQLFDVTPRSIRRWQDGSRHVPCGVGIVLRLVAAGALTVDQVELAAIQINGSAKLAPAPRRVAPAPEQSVVARTAAAALAGPGLTTAEKVCALASGDCRWPAGDPARPDFHFCGSPVVAGPYCERHRTMAHAAPPTRQGARGGPALKMLVGHATSSMPDHGVGRGSGLRTAIGKWNRGSELTPRVG